MPKVILQIAYDVHPERREDYLKLLREMREHFVGIKGKQYSAYEVKGRKNSFVEQFVCSSMEEFDRLEDDMDEAGAELVNRLEGLLKDGSSRYTTLIEVE